MTLTIRRTRLSRTNSVRTAKRRTFLRLDRLETRDVPSTGFEDLASMPDLSGSHTEYPTEYTLEELAAMNIAPTPPIRETNRLRFAVGTGPGERAAVNVYDAATNALIGIITPYGKDATFGARVAVGDVNGDGVQDIITAPGEGSAPIVKVFDGKTLVEIRSFLAFEESFTGGVFVAAGEVLGDGRADIVAGAGVSGGPRVRVFAGTDVAPAGEVHTAAEPASRRDYFAYEDDFRGGVSVAVADVDGDGFADIVTGAGPGGGPRVIVVSGKDDTQLANFFAYDSSLRSGISVSAGVLTLGSPAAFVTVPMNGGGPDVKIFNLAGGDKPIAQFAPFADGKYGNGVAVRDLTGDGRGDLILTNGPGTKPRVIVLDAELGMKLRDFPAFMPDYLGGLFVA